MNYLTKKHKGYVIEAEQGERRSGFSNKSISFVIIEIEDGDYIKDSITYDYSNLSDFMIAATDWIDKGCIGDFCSSPYGITGGITEGTNRMYKFDEQSLKKGIRMGLGSQGIWTPKLENVMFDEITNEALTIPVVVDRSEQLVCKCGLPKDKKGGSFNCMRTDCDMPIAN